MKHTKYFIIPLFIFSVFISSCSKEDLIVENYESALDAGKKGGKANSFYDESLPSVKFIPNDGTNMYTIVLKDPAQTATVQVRGRVKYNVLQFHFHAPSEQRATLELNDVDFLIEKFNTDAKVKNITFPAPVENWILSISLEYIEGDVVVKTFDYNLFVFADGTTALQKPEVRITKKGLVGSWSFDDSHGTDNSSATFSVIVENDPAEVVTDVEVIFDEKTSSPAPKSYTNYLKTKSAVKYGQCWVFSSVIPFTENPEGSSFTLQIALLDGSGNEISLLENAVSICLKPGPGKNGARIHAVRIKETNKGNDESFYDVAALVLNIKQERLGYVEIKFNESFAGPKPISNTLRLRKRPEILIQEWDALIDEHLSTEIQNNPLYNGEYGTGFNPLFEKSAIGYTYSVTATIFDKNEKPIGIPQTFDVTVEGETNETEPVVQSTRLFSTDGGKTWNLEAVIEDKSQWVEKVQVEFEKPIEGPAPVINPIGLTQVAEKEGNIKIYSGKVEFNGNPDGFDYIAIIYLRNDSGGYGDTVVARAPLHAISHEYN